jgi:hypothetical protein
MIMSNENVENMVDSLASGDNVAAQDAFKSALTDKIGDALDAKRQTVANDVYSRINKAPDPIVSKIEGIIRVVAKKHGVSTYDIEDYFDNELIK